MRAGIGLGSNQGERFQILQKAIESLHELSAAPSLDKISSVYETRPVNCAPGTPAFLNAVMEIETQDAPLALLAKLQALEIAAGRPAIREKNRPRSLDLDLLYVDNLALNSENLQLPHPFIFERQFVLVPLSEICPELVLPGQNRPVKSFLESEEFKEVSIYK
ncbi:MAG TPA: 2-amino-4-hydroxy-6-hydroxymethyldihydropteridine diphosphokinase [Chthoniobacterales bacterium]